MQLQSIRLHPFAGIADKTYAFKNGLTVIFGPNEEGKSTVARAIKEVFFLETNLTPSKRRNYLKDLMPVTGGDTICVTLNFALEDQQFTLEKQWGATSSVKLFSSDGVVITDNNTVQQKIIEMLPANQAVVEQILIASQSKLADAVSNLSEDVESSLSEKLRAAILSGGGINGTLLEQTINTEANKYYGRWDELAGEPEGGSSRGLTNRWTRGTGQIVEAWYEWEEAKKGETEIENYEIESNRLQSELNKFNEELKYLNDFLQTHKESYDAINKRISIELEIEKYRNALKEFDTDALRWPIALVEKKTAENNLSGVDKELADLNTEIGHARQKQTLQQDIKKLEHVKNLKNGLEEFKNTLDSLPEIFDEDVKSVERYQKEIMRCQSLINGQKLYFEIDPTVPGEIKIDHSGGQKDLISLVSGQKFEKEVTGSVQFEWQGLSFNIQSANEDITTLETSLQKATIAIDALLEKYAQASVEGLLSSAENYVKAKREMHHAKSNLESALGQDSFEELSSHCEMVNLLPNTRDIKVLEKLLSDKNKIVGGYNSNIQNLSTEISSFEQKYQSLESLDERRLKGKFLIAQKQTELDKFPPLPEGYESAAAFQEYYSGVQTGKDEKLGLKHSTELSIQGLTIPQLSLGEAKDQTILAEKKFHRVLAEGKAYRRIQSAIKDIFNSADANAFQPLHLKTESYLKKFSSGRFERVPFEVTQPQQLEGNGVALPVSLLSKGTKDILALALRLAAAEVYLANDSGFIIMDDPLVDMDSDRRDASVAVLKEFAEKHQTIIFTCHETHATMLNNG